MNRYESIPDHKHSRFSIRYLFNSKTIVKLLFFIILLIIGIGLLGSSSHDAKADSNSFNQGYQNAQSSDQPTGTWGTARWYIDGSNNMYIGSGQLQGTLSNAVGMGEAHSITSINFTSYVQAPLNSTWLLAGDSGNSDYNNSIQSINGLNNLDVSKISSLSCAFYNDSALTNLNGINSWNTSNINTTSFLFENDSSLRSLDLSGWNMSNAGDMHSMFSGDTSLANIAGTSNWNTNNATGMDYMFLNDNSLSNLNLANWNTINPSANQMLSGVNNLDSITLGFNTQLSTATGIMNANWQNGNRVLNTSQLFNNASNPGTWQENDFSQRFSNAQSSDQPTGSWGTAPWYIDGSNNMYIGSGQLQGTLSNAVGMGEAHSISSVNFTSSVQAPQDSGWLLAGDSGNSDYNTSIQNINGLDNLDVSNATSIACMFYNDTALTNLDGISNWNTSNAYYMNYLFENDNNLKSLNVSGWNTNDAHNMDAMFNGDTSLTNINGIGNWDTNSLNESKFMFNGTAINNLDLSHWNTQNVSDMANMFQDTYNLHNLNIANWNTKNVANTSDMFHGFDGSESLSKIDLSGWNTPNLKDMSNMFNNEANLHEVDLNNFNTRNANTNCAFIQAPSLNHLVLGNDTTFGNVFYIPGFGWQSGNQVLTHDQLGDGNAHPGDWERTPWADAFYYAHQKGYWGTAPWYIDSNNNMHIGSGQLQGSLSNVIGSSNSQIIKSLNFEGNVQAPNDSTTLLSASPGSNNNQLSSINGLEKMDTSNVNSMNNMFASDYDVPYLNISNWNTSNVNSMHGMFYGTDALNNLNINNWDVHNVNDMGTMFWYNSSLTNLDLSHWNTDNVSDMNAMFDGDIEMQHLNIGNFNTTNANMYYFFGGEGTGNDADSSLNELNLGNNTQLKGVPDIPFITWKNGNNYLNTNQLNDGNLHPGDWHLTSFGNGFDQAISNNWNRGFWGTSPYYIDNNQNMHVGAGQLQGSLIDAIGGTSNAQSLNSLSIDEPVKAPADSERLFSTLGDITSINGLSNVDTSQVTDMGEMFLGDGGVTNLSGINNWDTSNVTNMAGTFNSDLNLQNLDVSHWNTSNLNNSIFEFYNDGSLQSININNWDTTNTARMNDMFDANFKLRNLELGDKTYLKGGTSIGLPGYRYQTDWQNGNQYININQLTDGNGHPGDWNMSSFSQNMINADNQGQMKSYGYWGTAPYYIDNNNNMYVGTGQLQNPLSGVIGSDETHNLNSINLSEPLQAPQDSSDLFSSAYNAQNINGLSDLDTSQATSLKEMFMQDSSVRTLDLHNFNTQHVTHMEGMFNLASNLTNLDLSSFDTSHMNDMRFAFWLDDKISSLNLSSWDTNNVPDGNMADMFDNNVALSNLNLGDKTYIKGADSGLARSWLKGTTDWYNGHQYLNAYQLEDENGHSGDWQQDQFSSDLSNAKQNNWQTGSWGNASYYIDNNNNMYVGTGQLQGTAYDTVGSLQVHNLQSINFEEPVQAPQDSGWLLAGDDGGTDYNNSIQSINGLGNLDTSNTTSLGAMFNNDTALTNLDGINNWNTNKISNTNYTFFGNSSLKGLDLSNWNTNSMSGMNYTFTDDNALTDLNLSNWDTNNVSDNQTLLGANNLGTLTLGSNTLLDSSAGIMNTGWQNDDQILGTDQLDNHQTHPGTWNDIQVQNDSDINGSKNDNLTNLIEHKFNLPTDSGRVYIASDQDFEVDDHLKWNDAQQSSLGHTHYDDLYYGIRGDDGKITYYHSGLNVYDYTNGDDLQGDQGQSLQTLLNQHYGVNVTIDDDGDSTNNGLLQSGSYQVQYHYQDATGALHYVRSNLAVSNDTTAAAPYLIVNDHPSDELNDRSDIQNRLAQFFGTDSNATLNLSNVSNDTADYRLVDNNRSYSGSILVIPSLNDDINIANPPATNDPSWKDIVTKHFDHEDNIHLADNSISSIKQNAKTGELDLRGNAYPTNGQFINNPTVPYRLHVSPNATSYSVDNPVDDRQVQDVINNIDKNAQVVQVLDGSGNDVTNAYGNLATLPNNSNVSIKIKTDNGYASIHFNNINDLAEPDVDISHNSATEGNDTSNDELRTKIGNAVHENALNGFTVDADKSVSSDVKEIDYHFVKDVSAQGQGVNVNTSNDTVSGTAYVHYNSDNSSISPTYTIVQGDDAVRHIENVTGHTIQITQASSGQDLANLPVGSYDLAYQNTDMEDDNDATYHATVDVIPDYYFSPTQNNSSYNDNEAGDFKSYDYQNNGNHYKSVIDTHDYSHNDDNDHNGQNNDDDTVDGLHTTDNKPAHFDGKAPWEADHR